jgi:hypothetical protein
MIASNATPMSGRLNHDSMKIVWLFLVAAAGILLACSNKKNTARSENDLDAARNFIQAALSNDFKKAAQYMLDDSINRNYLETAARSFDHLDPDTRDKYRGASIRIHQPVTYLNDSTTIIIYSNSYKNDLDTLRVCRRNGDWLVDLKYLFEPQPGKKPDSTIHSK